MNAPLFEKRIANIQQRLEAWECDVFISIDPFDNAYLTGFFGSASALLVSRNTARLLCDFRYIEQARTQTRGAGVVQCAGNLDARLGEQIASLSCRNAAFEPETMTVSRYEAIKKSSGIELISAPGICRDLRLRKESGEIERIAAATALAEEAVESVLARMNTGVSECALAGMLEYEFRKRGAQRASFDTIVLFGERSSLPHGKPDTRPLAHGDIVLLDCGCVLDGYCSDLTRTFVFGRIPGNWFQEIYEAVRLAQEAALQAARAGAATREVDAAARMTIEAAGYGEQFGHGTGHGVGLEVHEAPRLNAESCAILESGMVVTVEPGIYLPGKGGVRIEDLIVVTETGSNNLNRLSKELRIL